MCINWSSVAYFATLIVGLFTAFLWFRRRVRSVSTRPRSGVSSFVYFLPSGISRRHQANGGATIRLRFSQKQPLTSTPKVSPDNTQRIEKFVGMRAFGMGAELFPFLRVGDARLVCQRFHVAVDRWAWPVRTQHDGDTSSEILESSTSMMCKSSDAIHMYCIWPGPCNSSYGAYALRASHVHASRSRSRSTRAWCKATYLARIDIRFRICCARVHLMLS
jgi:hypothetical protein